jgi:hypothetical protein
LNDLKTNLAEMFIVSYGLHLSCWCEIKYGHHYKTYQVFSR